MKSNFNLSRVIGFLSLLILGVLAVENKGYAQTPLTSNRWASYVDGSPHGNFGVLPAGPGLIFSQWRRYVALQYTNAGNGYNSSNFTGSGSVRTYIITDANSTFYIDSIHLILRRSNTGPNTALVHYVNPTQGTAVTLGTMTLPAQSEVVMKIPVNICVPANDSVLISISGLGASGASGTLRIVNGSAIYGMVHPVCTLADVTINAPLSICVDSSAELSGEPNANVVYNLSGGTADTITLDASGKGKLPLVGLTATTTINVTQIYTSPCCSKPQNVSQTVIVNPYIPPVLIDTTICSEDTITIGSKKYFLTGTYADTLVASTGCDSIINLKLQVNAISRTTENIEICDDLLPYTWHGQTINSGGVGVATQIYAATNKCDSIITLNLKVLPNLSVKIDAVPGARIDKGDRVTFIATAANEIGQLQFIWRKNGVHVGNDANIYADDNLSSGDIISCTVIDPKASCKDSAVSNEIKMNVLPELLVCPVPVSLLSTDISFSSAVFSWDAVADAKNYEIALSKTNTEPMSGEIITDTFYQTQISEKGQHHFYVRTICDDGTVSEWANITVVMLLDGRTTGIDEIEKNGGIRIYPNPNSGEFTLEGNVASGNYVLEIIDINGRQIIKNQGETQGGKFSYYVSLGAEVSSGSYLIRVLADSHVYVLKFMINR